MYLLYFVLFASLCFTENFIMVFVIYIWFDLHLILFVVCTELCSLCLCFYSSH